MKWLFLYIVLILAFAAWYESLPPHSLRDSNIENERSLERDGRSLLPALTAMVGLRATDSTWIASGVKLKLAPKTIKATAIQHTTDGRLLFKIEGDYRGQSRFGRFWQWIEVSHEAVSIAKREQRKVSFGLGYEVAQAENLGLANASASFSPPVVDVFPPIREPHAMSQPGVGTFWLTRAISRRWAQFFDAAEGDPAYASGKWLRALYFSATTIATLGLGDMTAVSSEARLAVGLEAPTGMIVLALFVSAVLRRRRSEDPV